MPPQFLQIVGFRTCPTLVPSIRLPYTTPNSTSYDWTVVHHDLQRSVRGVTSSAGAKVERTIYNPYGNWDDVQITWRSAALTDPANVNERSAASTPESRSYIGESGLRLGRTDPPSRLLRPLPTWPKTANRKAKLRVRLTRQSAPQPPLASVSHIKVPRNAPDLRRNSPLNGMNYSH